MPEQRFTPERIAEASRRLDGEPPNSILRWAVRTFQRKLTMATAFGAEGCCILHLLAEIDPGIRIFNLETGYQFPETLELRERIKDRYGIEVEFIRPELSVPEYEAEHGGPLYRIRPDQCCHDRKILLLVKRLAEQLSQLGVNRLRVIVPEKSQTRIDLLFKNPAVDFRKASQYLDQKRK